MASTLKIRKHHLFLKLLHGPKIQFTLFFSVIQTNCFSNILPETRITLISNTISTRRLIIKTKKLLEFETDES